MLLMFTHPDCIPAGRPIDTTFLNILYSNLRFLRSSCKGKGDFKNFLIKLDFYKIYPNTRSCLKILRTDFNPKSQHL